MNFRTDSKQAGMVGEEWNKRVDLVLYSGSHVLVLEFMRPGLKLDWDHLSRFEQYVNLIRDNIEANTAGPFRSVTGYLIADGLEKKAAFPRKIKDLTRSDMYALDWSNLFSQAVKGMEEYLETLVSRAPQDERLKALQGFSKRVVPSA